MDDAPDRDLWSKALGEDPEAFGEIFARHARPIYNYLFRRCGEWSTAEDLTSVVFLEAWRRRSDVRLVHDSALPFLFGVATNVLRNRRRSERRYREALTRMPAPTDASDPADEPAARASAEEDMRALLALLARLPRREQDVISLCLWMDLSYEEAGAALAIPVGTVRSRLSRGRGRLRELLGAAGHEEDVWTSSHAEQEGVS